MSIISPPVQSAAVRATGATAARTLADRFADVANILDFGADPLGLVDSTASIRAAVATGRKIWAPKGSYKVTDLITLLPDQKFFGDSRTSTVFKVDAATFNLAALGVFRLGTRETGASLEDCGIEFAQPQTTVRANLATFPPAIYADGASRFQINRVRVNGASVGLTAINSGGLQVNDFECSAFVKGIVLDNERDFVHIHGYHFWNFGISGASDLYQVYKDGVTAAAEIGRVDGLDASGWTSWLGNINLTAAASGSLDPHTFTNTLVDGGAINITSAASVLFHGLTLQGASNGANTAAPILAVGGGRVIVNGISLSTTATAAPISVTGGALEIGSGYICNDGTTAGIAAVSGGALRVRNTGIVNHNTTTAPLIAQSGSGALLLVGNTFSGISGVGISVGSDNANHSIRDNRLGVLTRTLPSGGALTGDYGGIFIPPADSTSMSSNNSYSFNTLPANNQSTAFGIGALTSSGLVVGNNTAFGYNAGNKLTTGGNNTALGTLALSQSVDGVQNTAFGRSALANVVSSAGSANIGFGYSAGSKITTGDHNVAIGFSVASTTLTTGKFNILIGTSAAVDTPTATTQNYLNLQNTLYGTLATSGNNASLSLAGSFNILGSTVDGSKVRATAAGTALTIPSNTSWYALVQTGTIASQTIAFPNATADGHLLRISTVGAITSLTLTTPAGTILGAPSALAANTSVLFGWDATSTQWLRLE